MTPADLQLSKYTTELVDKWKIHHGLANRAAALQVSLYLLGITLKYTEGHRTNERQKALWQQGRTTPGNVVTNAQPGQSKHNAYPSTAIDADYDSSKAHIVAPLAKALGLVWGGDFHSIYDWNHFELPSR